MIILKVIFLILITLACYKRLNEGNTSKKDILASAIVLIASWLVVLN